MKLLVGYSDDPQQVAQLKREIAEFHDDVEVSETDVGPAADFPCFLVSIPALLSGAFFLGERIEKNLDAWIRLVRRVADFIRRMKQQTGFVAVDRDGAQVLALETILVLEDEVRSIIRLSGMTNPIAPFRDGTSIDGRTDALFVYSFMVNDSSLWLIGVRSTSGVDFAFRYGGLYFSFSKEAERWFDVGLDPTDANFS